MKSCFVLSSIILITCGYNISEEYKNHKNFKLLDPETLDCGYSTVSRIVGGHEAKLGEYPWIASIGYAWDPDSETADEFDCGGALITDLHVLTAAHCSGEFRSDKYKWVEVRLGEHNMSNENTGQDCDKLGYCLPPHQDIRIESYYCHVLYENNTKEDDICILRLAKPAIIGVSVHPICLPFQKEIIKDDLLLGKRLEVAGWGRYNPVDYKNHKNFKLLDPQNLDCGYSTTSRIVGGHEAKLGQYPWIARLGYSYDPDKETADLYDCGGSLITDLHVLTAAHCSPEFRKDKFKWVEVRLGEHDTSNGNKDQDCDNDGNCLPAHQDIPIESSFCHISYEERYKGNDICILRLAKKVTIGVSVHPICLPFHEEILKDDLPLGKRLEVAGWGYYKQGSNESSKVLLRLDIPAVKNVDCFETFIYLDQQITEEQICAGGVKGEDSCRGDSGGPLMKAYSLQGPPKYFLLGIVSFGSDQCGDIFPGVYTDVRHYLTWILNNLLEDQNTK